jgi:hypothetical protein
MGAEVRLGAESGIGQVTPAAFARVAESRVGRPLLWLGLGGSAAILTTAHAYALTLPWNVASPWVMASHLFAVGLLAGLLWLGAAVGLWVLRALGLGEVLGLESLLFALGLGLGGVAYLVLACGLLGLLQSWVLAVVVVALAVGVRAELAELIGALPALGRAWLDQRSELRREPMLRLTLPLAELLLALLALRALAPPTGYDALVYHLEGPRQFLELGRLAPLVEPHPANMPFTVDMLFLLGLAFGSDELSSVLHLTLALLTALATFAFGRRFFGPRVGWLAAAIVASAPTVTFYAPIANIDFGWAMFDFLAVYAFAIWTRDRRAPWLIVAGLLAGLSLGSKYLGALTFGAIALGITAETLRDARVRPAQTAWLLARFVVPAALVAAPWYAKNWLWLGTPISPVWPYLGAVQTTDIDAYLARNMAGGRALVDQLLLPLRLLQDDPEYPAARLPILFALVPLYALARKSRLVGYLLALAALHIVVWAQLSATFRYLVPVFPALSLAVVYILDPGIRSPRLRRAARVIAPVLIALCMLWAAMISGIKLSIERPFAQLVGVEARQAYLSRVLFDYDAVRYVNEHRSEVSRLLVIGDARLFYLAPPVLIDHGLGISVDLQLAGDPRDAIAQLRRAGISHILIGRGHLEFLAQFDPEDRVLHWLEDFERARPAYLITEYARENVVAVYRVADLVQENGRP